MPRLSLAFFVSLVLIGAAYLAQHIDPGALWAVTLYKAHLMALAGWGGYWLDRALFPYDRPHQYLELADDTDAAETDAKMQICAGNQFGMSMMRRAIIVAACLVCIGLGA
jgi:hypothetical protein